MKNKSTIILGIVFLLLVGIYLLTSLHPKEVTQGATPLFPGTKPEIDKIELNSVSRGHIILEKKNGEWFITTPFEYKAYTSDVKGMIQSLQETMVDGVVSSRPEAQNQYEVSDSTGTSLKVYSAGKLVLDAIVGKQATQLGHSYVRKNGSNDIELWRGMMSQEVIRDADRWRDKTLYSYNREDVTSVVAVEGKKTRTLSRADSLWIFTENGKEMPVDQIKAHRLVDMIAELTCDAFADGNDIPFVAEKSPDIKTTFTVRNGDKLTFDIWKPEEKKRGYYLVRKTGGDIVYRFYQFTGSLIGLTYEKLKPNEGNPGTQ
jgi:hypothetical protein